MKRSKTVTTAFMALTLVTSIFVNTPATLRVFAQPGTSESDDRYGKYGKKRPFRTETKNPLLEDLLVVTVGDEWTDDEGRVMERETREPGLGDEITITNTYYKPGPDTQAGEMGPMVRRVTRRVRKKTVTGLVPPHRVIETEEELYFEEQWFDDGDEKQTRGYRRSRDKDGQTKVYFWNPALGYQEFRVSSLPGKTSAKSGYAVASEAVSGLDTTVFTTPKGTIRVNLPNDMSAGDTLSGTVSAEPIGKTADERAQNDGELSGLVVEIEKQRTSTSGASGGFLKLAIPILTATTYMVLRDKKGSEVARREINVLAKAPPAETQFDLPTAGQQGRPIEIRGPFDGDPGTTQIDLGSVSARVLAESPRGVIARIPADQAVGTSAIRIGEKGRSVTGAFRTLGLQLSAPKLNLMAGEQTTLTIKVTGLSDLKSGIPFDLENRSSGVIQMGGGNLQRINIGAAMAEGGTYVTERPLTGIKGGSFTITATVLAGRQRPAEGKPSIVATPGAQR